MTASVSDERREPASFIQTTPLTPSYASTETSTSSSASSGQLPQSPSLPFVDVDLGPDSSGASWLYPDGSSLPDNHAASSTASSPQASDASSTSMLSMGLFPEAPVVFLREWKGKVEIIGSWGGVFLPCEGGAGSDAFEYEERGQELPEGLSIIRFEPVSQDLLVRAPGQNHCWIIMTQQQQPAVTRQQGVEPVESQVGKWLDEQRQEQQGDEQTDVKEQVVLGEKNDLEDNAQEQKAREDEQEIIVDHQDGKDKQKEEGL